MPNLQDKLSEPPFPSELNPLTNPALERNLGRWAQVYFSNPPAKRQQAVSNLLEEIHRETGAEPRGEGRSPLFCPRRKNSRALFVLPASTRIRPATSFAAGAARCFEPSQTGAADHLGATEVGEATPPRSETDVQWLRDRAFSGLDGSDGPQRRAWKYLLGAVVLVLAGLAYLQWAPRPGTGVASSSTSPQVSAPAASLPQDSSPAESNPPEAISAEPQTPEAQNSATTAAHDHAAVPAGLQPASQKSPLPNAPSSRPALAGDESGASDLRLAQRYLGRQHGRTGFLRSREVAVEGSQETKCHRSGPAVRTSIYAETAFPAAAIRRAFCLSPPPGAGPRRRRNSCAIWNPRAVSKESRKHRKSKKTLALARVFCFCGWFRIQRCR